MAGSVTPKPYLYQDLEYLGGATAYADTIYASIRESMLQINFDREDCELLCRFMHCFSAEKGALLLEEGIEGSHMIFIFSGRVRVFKRAWSGDLVPLAMVGPGAVLGEMSLIDGEHRFASCLAHEAVEFGVLTREDLNEILLAHPRLGNKLLVWILQVTIGRVRDMDLRLVPQAA